MNNTPKIIRLKRLYDLLRSGERYLTAPKLAHRLEVSTRTIYRDINALTAFGVEIDGECGYRVVRGEFAPPFQLSANDLLLIKELIESSPLSQFHEVQEDSDQLLLKLEFLTSEEQPTENVFRYSEPRISERIEFSHDELDLACSENRVCEMDYQSLDENEPSMRVIHPYGVAIRGAQWYLIAFDEVKGKYRLYHLLRIKRLRVLDRQFDRDKTFQFDRFFEDSWNVFQGKKQVVRFRAKGIAARLISERTSPQRIEVEKLGADDVLVSVETRGEEEIINWALSMGPQVEIIEPAVLRERVRQLLSAALSLYEIN